MSKVEKKFAKKKERERKVAKKVLWRRMELRKELKQKEVQEKLLQTEFELTHGKEKPFIKDLDRVVAEEEKKALSAKEQLQKNIELLEQLEAEYTREQEVRQEINESLESQGCKTIKEKMDALHKKALEVQEKEKNK